MPRRCTICTHTEREAIDRALVAGQPLRDIAGRFAGLSKTALGRHNEQHIPALVAAAVRQRQIDGGTDLLLGAEALFDKTLSLLHAAEEAGDSRTALAGVREARGCVELLARLRTDPLVRPGRRVLEVESRAHDQGAGLSDQDVHNLLIATTTELQRWPSTAIKIARHLHALGSEDLAAEMLTIVPDTMRPSDLAAADE